MKYAKLINNSPVYAPNPIKVGRTWWCNPPDSIYTKQGYKPVTSIYPPYDPPAGYYWKEIWTEEDDVIVQSWQLKQYEDIPADMAMEILFGGENE